MADTSLQDRIRGHAMAVDGLLSLIPAKMYYGEDTSDQWSKKKQTKEEKKAAQRRNLDPDNERNKSVKEIMDERARKRKLEELEEQGDDGKQGKAAQGTAKTPTANKGTPQKTPKKAKADRSESNKKQKISTQPEESTPAMPSIEESQQTPKKQAQVGKKADKKKSKASKVTRAAEDSPKQDPGLTPETDIPDQPEPSVEHDPEIASAPSEDGRDGHIPARDDVMPGFDFSGLAPEEDVPGDSSSQASAPQSPTFDISLPAKNDSLEPASATTSISSTVPPSEKPKHIKLPSDTSALRVRLAARIEALRAARKADGADGSPIRTRQELIESRRVKQAQRKAHKKELRQKAKEEEERKREEALASARTSPGSIMSPLIGMGTEDDGSANHLAFGRIAFGDGAQMSHDLSYVKDAKSKKGSADPKTALAKLEAQKKRISALDADKRKEVLEKETWLAARRRAEGEKIRDDEALLKKAVKRKEKAKKRSEREWKERAKGVEDAIKGRQKKREENLRKRRDDKLMGKGKKKGGAGGSKKGRAGFEGTFGGGKRK